MRACVAGMILLAGTSVASAQFWTPEMASDELARCRRDYVEIFEPTRIVAPVPLVVISRERRRKMPRRKQRQHDAFVKFCKALERELERRPRGPVPPHIVSMSATHRAVVEELKRQPPPPEPPADPPSAWSGYWYIPGPTVTVFTDLGGQPSARDRDFPDFNQVLQRTGEWYASFGGLFNHPVGPGASHFWLSAGVMMFYLHSRLNEVRNLAGGGALRITGFDETYGVALLGGVGGRLPAELNRFEWQVLLGIGGASSSLRGSGLGGNELFRSRATVAAWLARAALYYWATENLKLGVVFGLIELERQTGTLANLTSFTIGTATNSYAGVSIGYTFGLR